MSIMWFSSWDLRRTEVLKTKQTTNHDCVTEINADLEICIKLANLPKKAEW